MFLYWVGTEIHRTWQDIWGSHWRRGSWSYSRRMKTPKQTQYYILKGQDFNDTTCLSRRGEVVLGHLFILKETGVKGYISAKGVRNFVHTVAVWVWHAHRLQHRLCVVYVCPSIVNCVLGLWESVHVCINAKAWWMAINPDIWKATPKSFVWGGSSLWIWRANIM